MQIDERHTMEQYDTEDGYKLKETEYISVHLPNLGNITLTYEKRSSRDKVRPVISIDFPLQELDIIDMFGVDRGVQ